MCRHLRAASTVVTRCLGRIGGRRSRQRIRVVAVEEDGGRFLVVKHLSHGVVLHLTLRWAPLAELDHVCGHFDFFGWARLTGPKGTLSPSVDFGPAGVLTTLNVALGPPD